MAAAAGAAADPHGVGAEAGGQCPRRGGGPGSAGSAARFQRQCGGMAVAGRGGVDPAAGRRRELGGLRGTAAAGCGGGGGAI